MPCKHSWRCCS